MWMVWLLWLTVVVGGIFMGSGYAMTLLDSGFDLVLALNAIVYLGCSAYGMPRLYALIFKRSA